MLVSAVHQHESAIGIHMSPPSLPPIPPLWVVTEHQIELPELHQQLLTGYLFCIWYCICFSATLNSSHLLLPLLSFNFLTALNIALNYIHKCLGVLNNFWEDQSVWHKKVCEPLSWKEALDQKSGDFSSGQDFVVWPLACHLSSLTGISSFVTANNDPGLHILKKGKVILCERLWKIVSHSDLRESNSHPGKLILEENVRMRLVARSWPSCSAFKCLHGKKSSRLFFLLTVPVYIFFLLFLNHFTVLLVKKGFVFLISQSSAVRSGAVSCGNHLLCDFRKVT